MSETKIRMVAAHEVQVFAPSHVFIQSLIRSHINSLIGISVPTETLSTFQGSQTPEDWARMELLAKGMSEHESEENQEYNAQRLYFHKQTFYERREQKQKEKVGDRFKLCVVCVESSLCFDDWAIRDMQTNISQNEITVLLP